MKILIAEDDYVNRRFLFKFFSQYGDCDMVVNGEEAVSAVMFSLEEDEPYDLICLDIMMPKLDGLKALKMISSIEKDNSINKNKLSKKFVITALDNAKDVQRDLRKGQISHVFYITKRFLVRRHSLGGVGGDHSGGHGDSSIHHRAGSPAPEIEPTFE